MKDVWLGIDLGGTRIKAGLVDDNKNIIARSTISTQRQDVDLLVNSIYRICDAHALDQDYRVCGIGLSITGVVDPAFGCVYLPGKIDGLEGLPLVHMVASRYKVPTVAENDGRAAALAEWRINSFDDVDNLLMLTIGTGIGSGVIIDRKLQRTKSLLFGTQCGHFVIAQEGPLCLTGATGTGESLASATALVQNVKSCIARGLPTSLAKDGDALSFERIAEAYRQSDPVASWCVEVWRSALLSIVLNSYYAYNPERILLSGGPTLSSDIFIKYINSELNRIAFRYPKESTINVDISNLTDNASWIGAALLTQETSEE